MKMNDTDMKKLDQVLRDERKRPVDVPDGLSQRILADAALIQAELQSSPVRFSPGIGAQLLGLLGGWPTLGSLVTACAAGVWIGFAPPSFLPDPVQLVMGQGLELDLLDARALEDAVIGDG